MSGVSGSSAKENDRGRGSKNRYVKVRGMFRLHPRVRVEVGDVRKRGGVNPRPEH